MSRGETASCPAVRAEFSEGKGMSEWKQTTLGNVSIKIGSGATPRGGSNSYKEAGISLIRSQNILDFKFSTDGLAYIDDDKADDLQNVTVEKNDVLLNITGDSVARCCIVPISALPARVNQHVSIVRLNSEKASHSFIFYLLQSMKEELLMQSEIGATRRALTKGMIESLEILLPPLPEQKAIASVLSSLDDKIDLLHRQNKTLEAIAETLFRQWFIEEAKENWEERRLLDIINLVGGGTPKTSISQYWDGEIPWLSGGDISSSHKSFIVSSEKAITQEGLQKSSAKILPQFATIITTRGTVGKYALLSKPMSYSQTNYGILPKVENCFFFTYLLINHTVNELLSSAYGSVFDTITTTTFRDISVALPSEEIIKKSEINISAYFIKKLHCLTQIQTLEKLRDTLLPKLMSGEVRVAL